MKGQTLPEHQIWGDTMMRTITSSKERHPETYFLHTIFYIFIAAIVQIVVFLLQHCVVLLMHSDVLEEHPLKSLELLAFGLFPLSGILETRKHDVSETGSVSVLR
jgi:hypothetical protein